MNRSEPAWLIVNADDYGYFGCVSRGILKAAAEGIVTATGVFATSPQLEEHAAWLRDCPSLDTGVHLNLTDREPLTHDMRSCLARWNGRFPGKFAAAMAVSTRAIGIPRVRGEWRAQIERCLSLGLKPRFLNSHEHLHMLPQLYPMTHELAAEYGIAHVRFAAPIADTRSAAAAAPAAGQLLERNPSADGSKARASADSKFRLAIMTLLVKVNRRHRTLPAPSFLGLEQSGKLDLRQLARIISSLRPGRVYELMCHPGNYDPAEVDDPRLTSYHDWEGELGALTNPASTQLLREHGVQLVGYRDLEQRAGRLLAAEHAT